MNMRRFCIASLLAAVSLNTWAAGSAPASAGKSNLDVNGTWNAKVEGRMPMTYVFVFKQAKDKLTGTMSANGAPPVEIGNGKVYKTRITFQVEMTMPAMPQMPGMPAPPANQKPAEPRKVVTRYEATVEGDTMTLEPQMGGGGGGGMGGGGGGAMGGGGGGMGGGGGAMGGGGGGMAMGGGGMRGMGGMGKIVATRAR